MLVASSPLMFQISSNGREKEGPINWNILKKVIIDDERDKVGETMYIYEKSLKRSTLIILKVDCFKRPLYFLPFLDSNELDKETKEDWAVCSSIIKNDYFLFLKILSLFEIFNDNQWDFWDLELKRK